MIARQPGPPHDSDEIGLRRRTTAEAEAVMYRALSKGLSFKLTMGNIITLSPPLVIMREEMDRALDILDECLTDIEREGAGAGARAEHRQEPD